MLAKQMRDLLEQDVTEECVLIDGKPPKVLARRGTRQGWRHRRCGRLEPATSHPN
jgi:hypothetical protein